MSLKFSNKWLSNVLHISESTVKTLLHRNLQKTGAGDRSQAVVRKV
ncbi:LuxR C-terminal-related transcriptional regulator [Lysinibacillus xylanilyticus]